MENKKYPVNIRFEYHQKDEKIAKHIIKKLEKYITHKLKIKKHFIARKLKKSDNQIKDDNKEMPIESKIGNEEPTKINIKIRINEKETYNNKLNKTDKIDLIKKDFAEKYPDCKNCLFEFKGKILKSSEDLNHYMIQDNDEIIMIFPY